jgi:ribosomal protein S21
VQVLVRDNNVDQALKALKKKMQREGIFREMKLRGHYEKPSGAGGSDPPRPQACAQEVAARGPVADEAEAHPRRARRRQIRTAPRPALRLSSKYLFPPMARA